MTSRERLVKVLEGGLPDCVPVCPDTSNMIPARLTGKPFWDIYLYNDPPIWKAYIDCVKYFGYDSLFDQHLPVYFEELGETWEYEGEEVIVFRNEEKIVTRKLYGQNGGKRWDSTVTVYFRSNPPVAGVNPHSIGLPLVPDRYEPVTGRKEWPKGEALIKYAKELMGDHGLIGVSCGTTKLLDSVEKIYDFCDNPQKYYEERDRRLDRYVKRFKKLMAFETKPDFLRMGASGTLVHQTPEIFRELGLPIVKKISAMAKEYGIRTHVHSCGPERELVKILAEETDVTVVEPLEIPPMGDCNLRELKEAYGHKLVLKGNIHTTDIMLQGTVKDVEEACKKAIDDAAKGGGFILSTGDQCGRDTPFENILAMIETAKSYGKY